jgi:integrase
VPAHIKKRRDRKNTYYLYDGDVKLSLDTTKKGLAEYKLERYIQDKNSLKPVSTVGQYFEKWIENQIEPLCRPAQNRDYRQHFNCYILPEFENVKLSAIGTEELTNFRAKLLSKLKLKTVRNIIDGSFRAFYRDARGNKNEALSGIENPFSLLQWPKMQTESPNPFTAEERDRIIEYWKEHDFFYFPWVFTLFHTGMRPSEASALRWADMNLSSREIRISKSRYMGTDSATKTSGSNRQIEIDESVLEVLKLLPSLELSLEHVFLNKYGEPMNAKKWSEHNWAKPLRELGIKHRKFYATRHTFITEAIKRGENPLAVAQYCGTSLAMIQRDYCGSLGLRLGVGIDGVRPSDRPRIDPQAKNLNEIMVAGPGFEPGTSRL